MAFYDDGTGLCFWCPDKAVDEMYGIPLCDKHYEQETQILYDFIGMM
jgi:hypothetical protein